jgi:hypothetical protein
MDKTHRKYRPQIGCIYVYGIGMENLYKIGMTTDPMGRLYALQAGNPMLFVLVEYWVDDPATVEENLHQMFEEQLYNREVFRLSDDNIKTIKQFLRGLNEAFVAKAKHNEDVQDDVLCYLNIVGRGCFEMDTGKQEFDVGISPRPYSGKETRYSFALQRKPGYILHKIASRFKDYRVGKREYSLDNKDIEVIERMVKRLNEYG